MQAKPLILLLFILLLVSCNPDEKENKNSKKLISVTSIIEGQVAHVDTSLYSIVKVEYVDTNRYDTSYIPREKFREIAKDFLSIPNLDDPKVAKQFKEEGEARYDEMLNRVILTYVPVNPDKNEIKKQEIHVLPGQGTADKVTNILVTREIVNRDSVLRQDLIWRMDKSFQVTTIIQKSGQPEVTRVTRVTWNDDEEEVMVGDTTVPEQTQVPVRKPKKPGADKQE
jgi:hypothetical protein